GWLFLRVSSGPVHFSGDSTLSAIVLAPSSEVRAEGKSRIVGTVSCAMLVLKGGLLQVTVGNHAPVVDAGPAQTIIPPANSLTLNGKAIDDGLPGGALAVSWSKVSGPGTVTFTNPNAAVTTATFSAAGTYVLRLTGTDSHLTGSSDVTITLATVAVP